jgi:hypothetical protein
VSGLPADGRTIYARLWTHYSDVKENDGWAANYHDYTFTAAGTAAATGNTSNATNATGTTSHPLAELSSPHDGATLSGASATFSWNAVSGADKYWLDLGNKQGEGYYAQGTLTGTSKQVTGLPTDGRKLYARLWTELSSLLDMRGGL